MMTYGAYVNWHTLRMQQIGDLPVAVGQRARAMEETRVKLIRAARQAFAEKGYAAASMDDLTAAAGLTRGALYHNFGDKKGLLRAVIEQLDAEMVAKARAARDGADTPWLGFLAEGVAYIELALEPEIQRIMLLDGPAVLGDPSQWPGQNACLRTTTEIIQSLIDAGTVRPVDAEAAARLINGAALNAALWIAASDNPRAVLARAVEAFRYLAEGLLEARAR